MTEPSVSVGPGGFYSKGNITVKGPVTHHAHYHLSAGTEALSRAIWRPEDYDTYFADLDLDRFTGCRDLIRQIDEFIAAERHGWVVIQGEAGVGKSALAAHLVREHDWFHHFTSFSDAKNPDDARKNLAAQLISVFGLDQHAPGGYLPDDAGQPKFLNEVIKDAAAQRTRDAAGQPIVLVIDTLAEMYPDGQAETPLGLMPAAELPHKVFVIVTQRPAPPLLAVGAKPHRLDLSIKIGAAGGGPAGGRPGSESTRDMREYLGNLFAGDGRDPELVDRVRSCYLEQDEFIDTVITLCAGVWMYLKYVIDDIRRGRRSPTDVASLPAGLREYYLVRIDAQRKHDPDRWQRVVLPALATLAALRQPVTAAKLAGLAGLSDPADLAVLAAWLEEDVRAWLRKARRQTGHGTEVRYEVRHQSLRDTVGGLQPLRPAGQPGGGWPAAAGADDDYAWTDGDEADDDGDDPEDVDDELSRELRDRLREAHAAITADLVPPGRDWAKAGPYARNTLAEHAANAGLLDELICDPGFLLVCQPWSVLLRRRYLDSGLSALRAYEAALSEWAGLAPGDDAERAWRLHVWARKTGAPALASACLLIARRSPAVKAAMWTGTTPRWMRAHDGSVDALTVLPVSDGRPLLASGGSDGRVRLWDPETGAPQGDFARDPEAGTQADLLAAHDVPVTATVSLPLPDGQVTLATAARDGTLRLWDPHSRKPFAEPAGRSGPVEAMTVIRVSHDRTALTTGGRDGLRVQSWDPVRHAVERAATALPGAGRVTATGAVPVQDGQLLAAATDDGLIRLWHPQSGTLAGELTGHGGRVSVIAAARVAGDRTAVAAGGRDGMTVWFWDPRANQLTAGPLRADRRAVNAVAVARLAGRTLFVAVGRGRAIRLWDAGAAAAVPPQLSVEPREVNAVATVPMPNGAMLIATGGSDGRIQLQELYASEEGEPASTPATGHTGAVTSIAAISQGGAGTLVSGGRDGTLRLWNPLTGASAGVPVADDLAPLLAIALVPLDNGQSLVATSDIDGTVQLRDPRPAAPCLRSLEHYAHVYAITAVRVAGASLLATGGGDGTVRLWNPLTGEPAGKPLAGHAGQRVNALAEVRLPGREPLLVTGGSDGSVQLWDPAAAAAAGPPLAGQVGRIRAVAAFTLPDGRTLIAAGGDDGLVQTWASTGGDAWDSAADGLLIGPAASPRAPVNAITTIRLPYRTLLATGDEAGMVRLWDPDTGQPAAGAWAGHTGPVRALAAVQPDGGPALLASGGEDKTILVWDVRLTGP